MPVKCLVKTCTNYINNLSVKKGSKSYNGIKMHQLPTDEVERNIWKQLAGRDEHYVLSKSSRICEEHFSEDALHGFKCKVLGTNITGQCKCTIQKGHFPTLKLPGKSMIQVEEELDRIAKERRKDNQKLVQELLQTTSNKATASQNLRPSSNTDSTFHQDKGKETQVFSESEVEDEPSVFQLEDLCRVCALAGGDMVGVFCTDGLLSKISLCLPVKMEEGDQLPANVCRSCLNKIEQSFELANMALSAEVVLKGMLQQREEDCQADPNNSEHPQQSSLPLVSVVSQPEPSGNVTYEAIQLIGQDHFETEVFDNVAVTYEVPFENTNEVFLCGYCVKILNTKVELDEHINEVHTFSCTLCNLVITGLDKNILTNHYNELHPNNYNLTKEIPEVPNYQCKICLKTYLSRTILKAHYNLFHSQILCYDVNCYDYFKTEYDLNVHCLHIHERSIRDYKDMWYHCQQCDQKYKSKKLLRSHVYYVHEGNEERYECTLCSKKFKSWNGLHRHKPLHKGEKNFKCQICNKAFPMLISLKVHQQTHIKERNFSCKVCNKAFKTSRYLKDHENHVHKAYWSYKCTLCTSVFLKEQEMITHYNSHSREEKMENKDKMFIKSSPYQCKACLKFYSNNFKLHIHKKQMHNTENYGKQFQCNTCCKIFKRKESLQVHLAAHMAM